jgi:hypothetical protein
MVFLQTLLVGRGSQGAFHSLRDCSARGSQPSQSWPGCCRLVDRSGSIARDLAFVNGEISGDANGEPMPVSTQDGENWHAHRGFGCSRLPCGVGLLICSAPCSCVALPVGWGSPRDYSAPSVVTEAERSVLAHLFTRPPRNPRHSRLRHPTWCRFDGRSRWR